AAVVADGLGGRRDMRLGERAAERRSAMAAGAEADELGRVVQLRLALVVLALELVEIDDHGRRRRLAGQRRDDGIPPDTRQGFACQMSAAYSAIVRSLENLPELATFRMAMRAQASGSAYRARSLASASRYETRSARCM